MNVLILEPNYSFFEKDIAQYISSNGKVYSLIFNLGFLIYLHKTQKIFIHHHLKGYHYDEKDQELILITKTLLTEQLRKRIKRDLTDDQIIYQMKYLSFLRDFLTQKQIDCVLMHNDLRWQHALAIAICKELGIKYLVTEFGIFRPSTITVDRRGVNAYSSISKDTGIYDMYVPRHLPLKDYSLSKWKG